MAAKKSGTGLDKNTAAALSYVLGPITGVIFLVLEKDSYVRFHAMQSIVVSVAWILLWLVLTPLSIALVFTIILAWVPPLFGGLLWIGGFILYLMLIYKAWTGDEWEIPVVGKYARKWVKKV